MKKLLPLTLFGVSLGTSAAACILSAAKGDAGHALLCGGVAGAVLGSFGACCIDMFMVDLRRQHDQGRSAVAEEVGDALVTQNE